MLYLRYENCFAENAWDDLTYWIENDIDQIKKIKETIKSIKTTPI